MEDPVQKRAQAAAQRAIGKPLRVRLDSTTTVLGQITSCRFVGTIPIGSNGKTKPQFEVVLSCGTAAVERIFTVNKLP